MNIDTNEQAGLDVPSVMSNRAIIEPPKLDVRNLPTRKVRYVIDSRDRNTDIYPSPSKYQIKLHEALTDVVKAELTVSDFKFNDYNVTTNHHVLHTATEDIALPIGRYDGPGLAAMLTEQTPFTVSYSPVTDKLTFVSDAAETLRFRDPVQKRIGEESFVHPYLKGSVGRVLGFDCKDYALEAGTPLEAPFRVSLSDENYIVMYMRQAKVYSSYNNAVHECFAILNKSETTTLGLIMHGGPDSAVYKSFRPPVASFSTLAFKFTDHDGNLYDFQNKEHRFEIVFTCMRQTRSYNEIFNT